MKREEAVTMESAVKTRKPRAAPASRRPAANPLNTPMKTDKAASASAEQLPSTAYLLSTAFHAMRALHIEPAFKEHDLTPLQYTILNVVQRRSGLSSADLSRRFYVTPQTMGQVLNGLEARGLLKRTENPVNRRVLLVNITPAGDAVVRACQKEMDRVEQLLFSDIAADDLKVLRKTLHQLAIKARGG